MAGIYLHIPFCRKQCHYCDFHRSTDFGLKNDVLYCMEEELAVRKNFLDGEKIETIYFGGGTPSVLEIAEINRLIGQITNLFTLSGNVEITFEANPDDLGGVYLERLRNETRINRLSIGIQSFIDKHLEMMNRRHNADSAITCIKTAIKTGFRNLSIDLIYGIPGMTLREWEHNLDKAFSADITHLSAYHLTFEENTYFYRLLQEGKLSQADEETSILQFNMLMEKAERNGFVHYEISNFAKEGFHSRHNTSYWKQAKYLGIGPSAHSYNGNERMWNVSDNNRYIERLKNRELHYEFEILDHKTKYNEFILTAIRTIWGVDIMEIKRLFGSELYRHLMARSENFLISGDIIRDNDILKLSAKGKHIADYITGRLLADL